MYGNAWLFIQTLPTTVVKNATVAKRDSYQFFGRCLIQKGDSMNNYNKELQRQKFINLLALSSLLLFILFLILFYLGI